MMKRLLLCTLVLAGCGPTAPAEEYGFVTRLGADTISVEHVTRRGDRVVVDGVDRFPRVRRRHTVIDLGADGVIRRLEMRITTPSEPDDQRERRVVATVRGSSVRIEKVDGADTVRREFDARGGVAMAHVPQMYSLYELYLAAALRRARGAGDTVRMRQFYIDREFDGFPLHRGVVRPLEGGRVEISHDWLAGTGEASVDSSLRLLAYSGARTTYLVDVARTSAPPPIDSIASRFEAAERAAGGMRALSVRDTVRAQLGAATLAVDYGRPLARGRVLLGGVIPYDRVWRTGANAATQLTTSAPIRLAGIPLPAGTYTLWTIPRRDRVSLVVNGQAGQWGTQYHRARDVGRAFMSIEAPRATVEQFTISIAARDERTGVLVLEWGPHRWTAPIEVQ